MGSGMRFGFCAPLSGHQSRFGPGLGDDARAVAQECHGRTVGDGGPPDRRLPRDCARRRVDRDQAAVAGGHDGASLVDQRDLAAAGQGRAGPQGVRRPPFRGEDWQLGRRPGRDRSGARAAGGGRGCRLAAGMDHGAGCADPQDRRGPCGDGGDQPWRAPPGRGGVWQVPGATVGGGRPSGRSGPRRWWRRLGSRPRAGCPPPARRLRGRRPSRSGRVRPQPRARVR